MDRRFGDRTLARLAWLGALWLTLSCVSCRCDGEPGAPDAGPLASSPVPAPAGLVAELYAPHPEQAWQKARVALGGSAFFLPKGLGALLSSMVDLPISAAPEVDGDIPVVGAVAIDPETAIARAVLGFHVKAGDRLVGSLTRGESAAYVARPDVGTGVIVLEPSSGAKADVALGVFHNYLLVGRAAADLTALGPYVARTLPTRAVPDGDVVIETRADMAAPSAAFRPLLDRAVAAIPWPAAIGEALVQRRVEDVGEVLADLESLRATWRIDERAARCELVLTPRSGDGPAARMVRDMRGGPIGLLDLPGDTLAAWGQHQDGAARAAGARGVSDWLEGFRAGALPLADRELLANALEVLAEGRGDVFVAGVRVGELGPSVFVKSSVVDRDRLQAGLEQLWPWLERPAVQKGLREGSLEATANKTRIERLPGEVDRIRLRWLDPKARPGGNAALPESIDVLILHRETPSELLIAAGLDSPDALRVLADPPDGTLSDHEAVRALVEPAATGSAVVGFVDLARLRDLRLGRPARGEPIVGVLSARADAAAGRLIAELSLDRDALPELARLARLL